MSLRVAVWCPQGRDNLPLAAALCRAQFPEELIVWSSEEKEPALPDGVVADLWLVLCADDPPPPAAWRKGAAGRWAVFPGTAARWTAATRFATEAWSPELVLSDLLPGETDNEIWHRWMLASAWRWLPAWVERRGRAGSEGEGVVVVTDGTAAESIAGTVLPVLAEALGGRVLRVGDRGGSIATEENLVLADRLLVWVDDPVVAGAFLRQAAELSLRIAVLSERRHGALRTLLLGGEPAWCGHWDMSQSRLLTTLRPAFEALLAAQPTAARGPLPLWSWAGWALVCAGGSSPVFDGAMAADFVLRVWAAGAAAGGDASFGAALRAWYRGVACELWRLTPKPEATRDLAAAVWCLERFSALGGGPWDDHLLARLRALQGDLAGAEGALDRFAARNAGDARELPGSVALALWRQGRCDEARRLLTVRAQKPASTAFGSFVLAVAGELIGEATVTAVQLDSLGSQAPFFFREQVEDGRWALAALVATVGGDRTMATRLLAAASLHPTGNEHWIELCGELNTRSEPVDTRWREIFDPEGNR